MSQIKNCGKCKGTGAIGAHPVIALVEKDGEHMCIHCAGKGYTIVN